MTISVKLIARSTRVIVDYAFMGTDLNSPDNRWLRDAMQQQNPGHLFPWYFARSIPPVVYLTRSGVSLVAAHRLDQVHPAAIQKSAMPSTSGIPGRKASGRRGGSDSPPIY